MHNWSTDTKQLQKDPEKYTIWKLEQLINYGLDGEKIEREALLAHWDTIKIDPQKRNVLAFWLWHKQS